MTLVASRLPILPGVSDAPISTTELGSTSRPRSGNGAEAWSRDKGSPDDVLHGFHRAPGNAGHAGVYKQPGDRVLHHVAPAAKQLQAAVSHSPQHLRAPQLADRGVVDAQVTC